MGDKHKNSPLFYYVSYTDKSIFDTFGVRKICIWFRKCQEFDQGKKVGTLCYNKVGGHFWDVLVVQKTMS